MKRLLCINIAIHDGISCRFIGKKGQKVTFLPKFHELFI